MEEPLSLTIQTSFCLADYWSESDQEDIDGSLTLKQDGPITLCDTYHRTPSVSYTKFMLIFLFSLGTFWKHASISNMEQTNMEWCCEWTKRYGWILQYWKKESAGSLLVLLTLCFGSSAVFEWRPVIKGGGLFLWVRKRTWGVKWLWICLYFKRDKKDGKCDILTFLQPCTWGRTVVEGGTLQPLCISGSRLQLTSRSGCHKYHPFFLLELLQGRLW